MTAHAQGSLKVTAGGEEYTLFVGMSVLADLQAKHGQDVLERVQDAVDQNKTPPLAVLTDLFLGALERYHAGAVDRWIVDDIIAENADAFGRLMGAAMPDAGARTGKREKAEEGSGLDIPDLLKKYIAAGFDPARFWDITPRLFVTEMEGAAMRAEGRRAEIWLTAMLPHMEKPIQFQEFVTGKKDRRADLIKCLSAWDKVDRALARNH